MRIIESAGARTQASLAADAGLSQSTLGDAIERGPATTAVAVKIAAALDISLDWMLTGRSPAQAAAVAASDADFVELARYDLRQLTDDDKGRVVERVPIRRDWLFRRLLTSTGLWLTELPSSYEALGLDEGDVVICNDIAAGAGPEEKWICIFRGAGGPFVGRYSNRPSTEDVAVSALDLASGDIHPIARVRARMLTRV